MATAEKGFRNRTRVDRRRLLAGAAATPVAALAAPALAQARARVVVVGGGVAGAAAAAGLAEGGRLEVTLVTAEARQVTGSFSNLYLAGFRSLASLSVGYDRASARAGYRVAIDRAVAVDREQRAVRLSSGARLAYERLVLAPGVSFRDSEIVGYDVFARELMPHGYQGGYQIFLLKERLKALREGGLFVITAPRAPFTGGLAPYERAAMAALTLGRTNPRAKVILVDANEDFPMRAAFVGQWRALFGERIEWVSAAETGGGLARVDAPDMTLATGDGGLIKVDGACVIPAQRAGAIVLQAGLADEAGWAAVEPVGFRAAADPAIHVIGDAAAAGPSPKAADAALGQAAAAAAAIRADLAGVEPKIAETLVAEYAFLAHQVALKKVGVYAGASTGIETLSSAETAFEATPLEVRQNALDANAWYDSMTASAFR